MTHKHTPKLVMAYDIPIKGLGLWELLVTAYCSSMHIDINRNIKRLVYRQYR